MTPTSENFRMENSLTSKLEKELDILNRHIRILKIIQNEEPIGIIRLSEMTGYPNHQVRYSLRILEEEGIVEPTVEGAVMTRGTDEYIDHFLKIIGKVKEELDTIEERLIKERKGAVASEQ